MSGLKKHLLFAMAMVGLASENPSEFRERREEKTIEELMAERRAKGIKVNYTPKPVKPWHGKKELSKKQRKNKGK